jgi:sRNA-binding carbon storage regulator CsrA
MKLLANSLPPARDWWDAAAIHENGRSATTPNRPFSSRRYSLLALTRQPHERIRIRTPGGDIWIVVPQIISLIRVKIAIEAPRAYAITREELLPDNEKFDAVHQG